MDNIPLRGQRCTHCGAGADPVFNLTVDVEEVETVDGRLVQIPAHAGVCQGCLVQAMLDLLRRTPVKAKGEWFKDALGPREIIESAPPTEEATRGG